MRLKHYIILILLTIMLTLSTSASFTSEWGEYQDDPTNRGFVHDTQGHFTSNLGITYTDGNDGMNYQALSVNITGDADLETIIFSGNYLQLYDKNLNLINELNIGTGFEGQPTIYDNGSAKFILYKQYTGTTYQHPAVFAYSYNGTNFVQSCNNTNLNNLSVSPTTANFFSGGIKCSGDFCYWVDGTGTTNRWYIGKMNMTANMSGGTCIVDSGYDYNDDSANGIDIEVIPAIGDIDRDGSDEIVIVCDDDSDNKYGLCVFDSNGTGTPYLDTGFSADGKVDGITGYNFKMSHPIMWNLDGSGDTEILFSYIAGTDNLYMTAFKSDGSTLWTDIYTTAQTLNYVGSVVVIDNGNSESNWDVCTVGYEDNLDDIYLLCSDNDGVTLTETTIDTSESFIDVHIISADIDTDGFDEIITSYNIFETDGTLIVNLTTADVDYYVSVVDVDQDGELEIVATKSGTTRIIYSNFTNNPPTIYNNLSFGGYGNNFGYSAPICINTTITFSAQECGGTASCNYDNDGSTDTERIVGNCGQLANGEKNPLFTTNLANGTLAGSNPQFACFYNVTGIFNVRHYLQDNSNLDDFTQYNSKTIVVNVINGQSGVICNIPEPVNPGETVPSTTTDQQAQTNEAIDDTFGILFGTGAQSDKLKLIVGLAIVISITIWAAKEGLTSGVGLLAIALVTTVLVTFLGLLTPAILLIVLMSLVLLMLFSKFISPSAGEGG